MIKRIVVILLAVALPGIAPRGAMAVDIRGFPACAAWMKHGSDRRYPAMVNESWLLGYLSGRASGLGKDFLKDTSNEFIYHWVDNYCRAYPLKDLDDAARELGRELIEQKGL